MYAELARICRVCKILKPNEEFHLNGYRKKNGKSAPRSDCKKCSTKIHYKYLANEKKRKKVNARRRECYQKNINGFKDKVVKLGLQKRYNLTIEDYNKMLKKQNGKCAMCKISQDEISRKFDVDHCHTTGKVRALLCLNCNRGLGLLKDNIEVLKAGIKLLKRARSKG